MRNTANKFMQFAVFSAADVSGVRAVDSSDGAQSGLGITIRGVPRTYGVVVSAKF